MQTTVYVRRVRIYNRGDCCQWRLDNFEIRIGNDPTFLNNAVCVTAQPTFSDFKDFTCVMSGRYISLQVLHNDGHLMFREFEVYGTKLDLDPNLYMCRMCPRNMATNNTGSNVCSVCAAGKTTDGRAPFLTVLGTHSISRGFPLPPQRMLASPAASSAAAGPAPHAHPAASKRPHNQTCDIGVGHL